jgi:O-antigen/teichoic acid export membrane protein
VVTVAEGTEAGKPWENLVRGALGAGAGKVFWDVASRALSFALSILVARKLGAEGFGTYAVYWYSAWMASQATDLGLHLVSLRSLSRSFEPRVFWSAVLAKAGLSAAVVAATGMALAAGALPVDQPLLLSLLAAQLCGSWVELLGVTLRSRREIAREGLLLTLLRSGWLAAALWALSRGSDLMTLAQALALSSLPALALGTALVGRIALPFQGTETRSLMGKALPLGVVSAMTLVYLRADLLIVAAVAGASQAGLFQSAFRLFEATFVISGGVAAGTFPLLASRIGEKGFESLARFLLAALAVLSVPIALAFALFPGPILALLYGGGFEGAKRPLAILGIALVAVFANALTTHLLVASARNRRLVLSIAVRLVVGIALDFLLVPRWGATGAAIAVAAAEWSLLFVSFSAAADLLGLSIAGTRGVPREEVSPCS